MNKKVAELIECHIPLDSGTGEPGDCGCSCDEPLKEYTWRGYCEHLARVLEEAEVWLSS